MANVLVWLTAIGLVIAAAADVGWRLIPNVLIGALLAVALLALLLGQGQADPIGALLGGFAVLVAGMCLFAAGLMGGGDVKLLAVTSLWAAPDRLLEMLFVMTLAGGVLGLLVIAGNRLRALPAFGALPPLSTATVPYGVAIAAAGLWVVAPRL